MAKKISTPWVVVKDNAAKCLRCGASEAMPLPMSIPDFVKWSERFTTGHSACTSGLRSDYWYDRSQRLWIVTVKDSEGNQVGAAEFEPPSPKNRLTKATAARMLRDAEEARLAE